MNRVVINGNSYEVPDGCSISMIDNVLYVDGKVFEPSSVINKTVRIEIHGTVSKLEKIKGDVEVYGDVSGSIDAGGSVAVTGNAGGINAGGSAQVAGNVNGNINAGGSVKCNDVGGNVIASSVKCNRI